MPTYTEKAIEDLTKEFRLIRNRRRTLFLDLFRLPINDAEARRYLHEGVMRRLNLVCVSIEQVFSLLPPDLEGLPPKDDIDPATLMLHAHIINVFGTLDCWAHVWANNQKITRTGGGPFPRTKIGLQPKYEEFAATLPEHLAGHLKSMTNWFEQIEGFRHALAHRVPPYIPPRMVDPSHKDAFARLQIQLDQTIDRNKRRELEVKIDEISHFKAFLSHDLRDQPPLAFHAQAVTNFLTLEDISIRFASALNLPETNV